MLSWFQTATGEWHTNSILYVVGWLSAGIVVALTLHYNMRDRINTYQTTQRTLSADKMATMVADLKDVPKQPVKIYVDADDSMAFGSVIQSTLQKAGFDDVAEISMGNPTPFYPLPIHVSIWTVPGKKISPAETAILEQLYSSGARRRDRPATVPKFDGVVIAIGKRA